MSMDKKRFYTLYVLSGIMIVLLSIVIVVAIQPNRIKTTPAPTKEKEIYNIDVSSTPLTIKKNEYTEKTLNFSFAYPDTLTSPEVFMAETEKNFPYIGYVRLYDKNSKEQWDACGDKCVEGEPDTIYIFAYRNPKKLSSKDWVIENINTPHIYTNYDPASQVLETFRINGKIVVKYSWFGLGGADVAVLSDEQSELMYMLEAAYMDKNSTIRGDLWYVLTSFKLLDNK